VAISINLHFGRKCQNVILKIHIQKNYILQLRAKFLDLVALKAIKIHRDTT
jgi:hypothetical protein